MHTAMHFAGVTAPLLTVQAPEDIEFLIKESEVLTGQTGRTFIIAGADRLVCRVHWHPIGVKVEHLGAAGLVLSTQYQLLNEFRRHSLIDALTAGQLFTPPVRRLG
jgi:hypothetical protein